MNKKYLHCDGVQYEQEVFTLCGGVHCEQEVNGFTL